MNINMYLAFLKWVFMKMFSGSFSRAKEFRYELKRGSSHTALAILAYIMMSMISFMIVGGLTLWLVAERETINMLMTGYCWAVVITFVYNVVKAAFECFLAEREELFDTLKKDYP